MRDCTQDLGILEGLSDPALLAMRNWFSRKPSSKSQETVTTPITFANYGAKESGIAPDTIQAVMGWLGASLYQAGFSVHGCYMIFLNSIVQQITIP